MKHRHQQKQVFDFAAEDARRQQDSERADREERLIESMNALNALLMGFMTGAFTNQNAGAQ